MSNKRQNEDSGLVDLDAMMKQSATPEPAPVASAAPPAPAKEAAATARAPSTPDDSLSAVAADAKKTSVPPPAVEVAPAKEAEVAVVAAPASASRRGRRLVVVAMAAAAAAVAVFAVTRIARAPVAVVASGPVAVTAVKAAPVAATPAVSPQPSPTGVDPSSLPTVAPDVPVAAPKVVAPHVAASAARLEPAAQIAEKEIAPAAPSDPSDLGAAMQSAVGSRNEAKVEDAKGAGDPNARQVRPSPGAVIGAMNAVLPAARACLGPDGAMRSGTLVFKSDGSVGNVALKGAKSEDECVRGALAKARVQPFSDVSFTTGFTVRP